MGYHTVVGFFCAAALGSPGLSQERKQSRPVSLVSLSEVQQSPQGAAGLYVFARAAHDLVGNAQCCSRTPLMHHAHSSCPAFLEQPSHYSFRTTWSCFLISISLPVMTQILLQNICFFGQMAQVLSQCSFPHSSQLTKLLLLLTIFFFFLVHAQLLQKVIAPAVLLKPEKRTIFSYLLFFYGPPLPDSQLSFLQGRKPPL